MTLQQSSISAEVGYLIADALCGNSVTVRQIDHGSPEKVSLPAVCFHEEKHWVQHNPFRGQRASPRLPWSASCSSVGAQWPQRSPLFFSKHGFSTALADRTHAHTHTYTHTHTHTHWTVSNHFCCQKPDSNQPREDILALIGVIVDFGCILLVLAQNSYPRWLHRPTIFGVQGQLSFSQGLLNQCSCGFHVVVANVQTRSCVFNSSMVHSFPSHIQIHLSTSDSFLLTSPLF